MSGRLLFKIPLLILLLCFPTKASAEPQTSGLDKTLNLIESQKILAFLRKKISANQEAIKTWEGTYDCIDRFYDDDLVEVGGVAYWKNSEGQLLFWLDQKQKKLRVNFELTTKPKSKKQLTQSQSFNQNNKFNAQWIVRPEDFHGLTNKRIDHIRGFPKDVGPGRVLYRTKHFVFLTGAREIDPKSIFGSGTDSAGVGIIFTTEACRYYADVVSGKWGENSKLDAIKESLIKEKIDKAGHKLYFIKFNYLPISRPFGKLPDVVNVTFDSTVGFNPTLVKHYYDSKLRHERTLRYRKKEDIFVPEKVEMKYFKKIGRNQEELFLHRKYILIESNQNQSIDPSLFEIKSLKLKYGERMLDSIKNQAFVQDRQGLVPAKDFVFKAE